MLEQRIADGSALKKLARFVEAQGGDAAAVYDTDLLPKAAIVEPVLALSEGYVQQIACDEIGICSLILGGGRETKESEIDLSVGLVLEKKVGDYVKVGETLAVIHANDRQKLETAKARFYEAYTIGTDGPAKRPLIFEIVQ
jgi:pyrimidine-nucleoside phosphorylase